MFNEYIKNLIIYLFSIGIGFLVVGWWILPLHELAWVPFTIIILLIANYLAAQKTNQKINKKYEQTQKDADLYKQSLREKNAGFPSLFKAIDEYEEARDKQLESFLMYKKHPARKSADIVKEEAHRRRKAEYENKRTQAIVEYYESIAPFLVDLKNDIIEVGDDESYRDYTDEEKLDETTHFLTKDEFRKLSSVERNQMALDRFWTRPKSKWLIGRIYERYIGYLYEKQGYNVEYVGIWKGYEDLGRDLVCQKDNDYIIIQCKNWSQFKTIYEKHIFQFFGTVFQYKDSNPGHNVRAIFYTSTQLSDLARRFAQELSIELKENYKFDETYPCIKCNVSSRDNEKIYHLPFDQQYDKVKIEKNRGEFYCVAVKEAERKGFRRAFRYKGNQEGSE